SITETVLTGKLHGGVGSLVDHINVNSLDLSTPAQKPATPAPVTAPGAPAPVLQAPAPQTQSPAPAQNTGPDLSILSAPTVQPKGAPAPQAQTPAPQPAP